MRPETVLLATGGLSIATGYRKEGHFPQYGTKSIVGIMALILLASATYGSRIEPIVKGIAWLMFLGALYAAVPAFRAKPTTGKAKTNG